jgi:flagellar biogenesis protein FliO
VTAAGIIARLRQQAGGLAARLPAKAFVRHAQVVQTLPLGPGARLMVVEFAGRRLLVGQSRAGLTALADTAAE